MSERAAELPVCLCGTRDYEVAASFDAPPVGEVRFDFGAGAYRRDLMRCRACGHVRSVHSLDMSRLYDGAYVDSTYGEDGIRRTFDRIVALDPAKSDNVGRVARVSAFGAARFAGRQQPPAVLDVGSGLCVFLHRLKNVTGWDCTALDPDPRAARHAERVAGVKSVCADFMRDRHPGTYDVITFNKVLEHVLDPVAMLAASRPMLAAGGFVYIELPDAAGAAAESYAREEFFIDHHHVFTLASMRTLAQRAGFDTVEAEALREPSGKYTLRAFLQPNQRNESMSNVTGERRYEQVYGDTFALYSQSEMIEFIEPFKVRFEKNGLDARSLFAGKRCLDAACGNGRGALFMLMNGAAHVTACDFSAKNVETTRGFLQRFGFRDAEVTQLSLESLPFPDEKFDFVWCNGVLMHTAHPNRCLQQITRVLKVGGRSWIYVYGSGGVYWRTIQWFREWMRDVPVTECLATLQLLRYETRYVAEFIDDWFATHLRSYTHADFGAALTANGFAPVAPLPFGTPYDTSHRRNSFGAPEPDLMGEGDLRYLLDKQKPTPAQAGAQLDEGEYGSKIEYPKVVSDAVDAALQRLRAACPRPWQRIAAAAHVQRELRLQMTENVPFDLKRYTDLIDRVAAQAAASGSV